MNSSIFYDSSKTDAERRERLYRGDIFVFSPTRGSRDLISLAQKMLAEAFAPHDPREVHRHKTPAEVAEILATLKPRFIHHHDCKKIIPDIMREHGVDLEKLYF